MTLPRRPVNTVTILRVPGAPPEVVSGPVASDYYTKAEVAALLDALSALKAPLASPAFTGTPTLNGLPLGAGAISFAVDNGDGTFITPTAVDNGNGTFTLASGDNNDGTFTA